MVGVSSPGELSKAAGVSESYRDMVTPRTTDTSNLHCLASVYSLISTGHQIYCPYLLEKELTPVSLQATMYSQKKSAITTAKQHTATMLTTRARTPLGPLDPISLSGMLMPHHYCLSN
jgi:hypothetical protein